MLELRLGASKSFGFGMVLLTALACSAEDPSPDGSGGSPPLGSGGASAGTSGSAMGGAQVNGGAPSGASGAFSTGGTSGMTTGASGSAGASAGTTFGGSPSAGGASGGTNAGGPGAGGAGSGNAGAAGSVVGGAGASAGSTSGGSSSGGSNSGGRGGATPIEGGGAGVGGAAGGSGPQGGGPAGGAGGSTSSSGGPRTMGYVGCSMSVNVMQGYQALGGMRLWGPIQAYNGVVVQAWASNSGGGWQAFDQQVRMNGVPTDVWVMLCIFNNMVTYDETKRIIANVRQRAPNAKIYITGQPLYAQGLTCDLAGQGGPEKTDQMAKMAGDDESLENVEYGGTFGPMTSSHRSDSCHANTEGQRALGQQAIDKWGK